MKDRISKIVSSAIRWLNRQLYWIILPVLMLGALWCSGAFFCAFDAPLAVAVISVLALWLFLLFSVFMHKALLPAALIELVVLTAFFCITPQQRFRNTVWQKPWTRTLEVRKLADGRYELHNIRDFHYRSEHDFDMNYRTVTVDPEQISSIDAAFSHWDDMESVAHSMLGLNFKDGTTIVVSLETRLPNGMEQDAVNGFYRRYALAMLAGTPEDLYGLRTDHRGETLYVYRLRADHENMLQMTLALLRCAEKMQKHPEYYNSLFKNCTTGLLQMLPNADRVPSDIRVVLNGMAANMLFNADLLECRKGESFGSLRSRSMVPGICRGKGAPQLRYAGESEAVWLRDR